MSDRLRSYPFEELQWKAETWPAIVGAIRDHVS